MNIQKFHFWKFHCSKQEPPYLADWINWTEIRRGLLGASLLSGKGGGQTEKASLLDSLGLLTERSPRLKSWTALWMGPFEEALYLGGGGQT